jgi:rod shape-determining protein MreC
MTERQATITFVVAVLLLLGLLAHQVRRADGRTSLSRAVHAVTSPVTHGVIAVSHKLRDGWNGYIALRGASRELEDARRRIELLEAERSRMEELIQENRRLRELVDLQAALEFRDGLFARVIADLSEGPLRSVVLVDRGGRDGVESGWVATAGGAVVGRVISARRRTAEVMLIVDPDSGIAVRHQLDRYAGVLRGGNRGAAVLEAARLEYVPRDHAVAVGDPLVTSGLDGLYPAGLLVGHVRELHAESPLTWGIDVEVAFEPDSLEEVLLVPPRSARTGGGEDAP